MALKTLILVYVAGGLTFIPLLLLTILGYAYLTLPKSNVNLGGDGKKREGGDPHTDVQSLSEDGIEAKSTVAHNEPEVAAAYFAVCREYVPGGINGKPPERSTPAGEVLIAESPSVYQSMYRSIFERGKTSIPTLEGDRRDGKAVKRGRNVFYVVLRLVLVSRQSYKSC